MVAYYNNIYGRPMLSREPVKRPFRPLKTLMIEKVDPFLNTLNNLHYGLGRPAEWVENRTTGRLLTLNLIIK